MPPLQHASQQAAMQRLTRAARATSLTASTRLMEFLDSSAFRNDLQRCCTKIAARSAQSLLDELRARVAASELVHAFDDWPNPRGSAFDVDVTLELLDAESEVLPSESQLRLLGHTEPDLAKSEHAENIVYGLEPPRSLRRKASSSNALDASSRLFYASLNLLRTSFAPGHARPYGRVTAVLAVHRSQLWREARAVAVVPVDSGEYVVSSPITRLTPRCDAECITASREAAINNTPGVLPRDIDHVLLGHQQFWSRLCAQPLARMFARWHGDTAAWTALSTEHTRFVYVEAAVFANLRYSDGPVKLLVGLFPALFGTARGQLLQQVARKKAIALAWAYGDGTGVSSNVGRPRCPNANQSSSSISLHPAFPGLAMNRRLMDVSGAQPRSLAFNASTTAAAVFAALWAEASRCRRDGKGSMSEKDAARLWRKAEGTIGAAVWVDLPSPGACADAWDACLGVSGDGRCICYGDRDG
jgi:hypothetical protein